MVSLNIQLPEELRARVAARAAESGHSSVEQYVEALLRADADPSAEDPGAPEHLRFGTEQDVEAMLLSRLDKGGTVEATPEFWEALRQRIRQSRQEGRSG